MGFGEWLDAAQQGATLVRIEPHAKTVGIAEPVDQVVVPASGSQHGGTEVSGVAAQRHGDHRALRTLGRADGLDRQLRRRRRGAPCRRNAGPGVLRLRCLQARRGHGLGGWPYQRRGHGLPAARAGRADRPGAGARRPSEHHVRPARASAPLQRPAVGPRAVLLRPPDPGGDRARPHARRGPAGRDRGPGRRPRVRHVRSRRRPVRRRAPGDRARARRARSPHRREAVPGAGAAVRRAARSRRSR